MLSISSLLYPMLQVRHQGPVLLRFPPFILRLFMDDLLLKFHIETIPQATQSCSEWLQSFQQFSALPNHN